MSIGISSEHPRETVGLRDVMCDLLIEMAEKDGRVLMLDADLIDAAGTRRFADRFPERAFECGIAEANMAGVAAGLSLNGFIPFIHTFGVFASRRIHDQLYISGAYAGANVKILGSDPGVTATLNGGTHMPLEDIALMRAIPEMTVVDLTDSTMLRNLVPQIKDAYGMAYIRMPRRISSRIYEDGSRFTLGKAAKVRDGSDATVFASGYCVGEALAAAESLAGDGVSVAVFDMFTIKPLDTRIVVGEAERTGAIVTAENHNVIGGLGSAVAEALAEGCPVPMERVGVGDRFGEVGTVEYLAETFGITAECIAAKIRRVLARKAARKGQP